MKNIFKNGFKKLLKGCFELEYCNDSYNKQVSLHKSNLFSQLEQKRLFFYYQSLKNDKKFLPNIKDVGFRVFSQSDEDGILLYIFALIGFTNKVAIDVAHACPLGANTTNLICNWGWSGLLVCCKKEEINLVNNFFSKHPDTFLNPPKIINKFITVENINDVIAKNNISGEIDLFNLDIDGVDYWIWKSLEIVKPRVVVVEFNSLWGNRKSVTVPYDKDFDRFAISPDFLGASLPAFVKLAKEKGYRLVGLNKYGFNAFFVKDGIAEDLLPALTIDKCFSLYSQPEWLEAKRRERFEKIKDLNWTEV